MIITADHWSACPGEGSTTSTTWWGFLSVLQRDARGRGSAHEHEATGESDVIISFLIPERRQRCQIRSGGSREPDGTLES